MMLARTSFEIERERERRERERERERECNNLFNIRFHHASGYYIKTLVRLYIVTNFDVEITFYTAQPLSVVVNTKTLHVSQYYLIPRSVILLYSMI
jgi:hypothetical protein